MHQSLHDDKHLFEKFEDFCFIFFFCAYDVALRIPNDINIKQRALGYIVHVVIVESVYSCLSQYQYRECLGYCRLHYHKECFRLCQSHIMIVSALGHVDHSNVMKSALGYINRNAIIENASSGVTNKSASIMSIVL